jgi:hypothetical protein
VKLKDFIGKHVLTGCQSGSMIKSNLWNENSNTLDFILDGKTYSAVEDPDDGYRSAMKEIIEARPGLTVTNTFPPCEVLGVARFDGQYDKHDAIDFYDTTTGKVVMSIGTLSVNDYYPCFIANFKPENMAINNQ